MKLGCRWDTDPPCQESVAEWKRIILDTAPVAVIGLCATHLSVFDRAVSRGGIEVIEALGEAIKVKASQ